MFTRIGIADKDTNPVPWAVSGGVGGRGLFPSRGDDTIGVGYFYNEIDDTALTSTLGVRSATQGAELFYDFALTEACTLGLDAQVVDPVEEGVHTATVFGIRINVGF